MKPSKREANPNLPDLERLAAERLAEREGISLQALVEDLSGEMGCTTDVVTEGLMRLRSRKVLDITERTPFASLASYAASPLSVWFWGAMGATLLSVVLLSATSGLALYLRYAFGSLLVLFLPGYSLLELVYPKKQLEELTRFALSIGLSLALVPLVELILSYTPFGLGLLPVAFSISGITVAFLILALRRKHMYYKVARDLA